MRIPSARISTIALSSAAALWFLTGLCTGTMGLRMATVDDLNIGWEIRSPAAALAIRVHDFRIGRFYADTKFSILEDLMRLPGDAAHSAARIAAFLIAVLAAAWFTWEWRRNGRVALLVLLAGVGFAPVSVGYQALLSFPTLWIGWASVWAMGALSLRRDSAWTRSGIQVAFTLALLVHESNAVFLAWPILLGVQNNPSEGWGPRVRRVAPCLVILVAYGTCSLLLRRAALAAYPGGVYDGASLSLNPGRVAFALNAYTWSGLPGFDSWLTRSSAAGAPPFLSPPGWAHRALAGATAQDICGAALLGAAFWMLTGPGEPQTGGKRPVTLRMLVILFLSAFAPNLILSCTVKYQIWAHHRMWPYYYTAMSYLVWVVLLASGISEVPRIVRGKSGLRAARLAVASFVFVAAVGIGRANREAVALLRLHPLAHMTAYLQWFPAR
jgi:hypothetical protein